MVGAVIGDDAEPTTVGLALIVAGVLLAAALFVLDRRLGVPTAPRTIGVRPADHPHAGSPPVAGSWQPDPSGRYDYRWWDGVRWTDQVATADGRTGTDPHPS
jgi:hypothetical protein